MNDSDKNLKKIAVIASGRGSNLQAILDKIADGTLKVNPVIVISDHKDAKALDKAKKAGIPVFSVERKDCADKRDFENRIDAELKKSGADLVVLAGFMRILSGEFLSDWVHKVINIHPALLPGFTGLDAQGQAVRYGVKFSGCTVHFVDEGTDTGPIILQKVVPVLDDDTAESLADRILVEEHKALPEAIKLWSEGKLEINGRKVTVKQ